MPRSADGPVIARSPCVIAPEVGRPAPRRRSSVDLPQPDGPTMHENSRSGIASAMSSSAVTGRPLRPAKRTVTSSIRSLPKGRDRGQLADHGSYPAEKQLEQTDR